MAHLFSEPVFKNYRTSRLSCSYIFCWILTLTAIFLPFFLVFSTNGFWVKRIVYEEQPKVLYRKEIFIQAYSASEGPLTFSSMQSLNDLYFASQSPMTIKSAIRDYNFDDKPDMYDFNITLVTNPADLRNIKVITMYDYMLRDIVRLDMVTMALLDIDLPFGGSHIFVDGHLKLQQKNSILPTTLIRTAYNETFLETDASIQTFLPVMLQRYNERNETTVYQHDKPIVLSTFSDYGNAVTLHMIMRIPANQDVVYKPQFLEVCKFAWVQYFALFLPVCYILYQFARFIYGYQILESTVLVNKQLNSYQNYGNRIA